MIRRRVSDVVIRFARNSDNVRLTNFKRVRGLDREGKDVFASAFDDQ
jgi:hypothetical protein